VSLGTGFPHVSKQPSSLIFRGRSGAGLYLHLFRCEYENHFIVMLLAWTALVSAIVAVLRDVNLRSVVEVLPTLRKLLLPPLSGLSAHVVTTFLPDCTHSSYPGEAKGRPRKTSVSLDIVKGKGKVYPRTCHEGPEGE